LTALEEVRAKAAELSGTVFHGKYVKKVWHGHLSCYTHGCLYCMVHGRHDPNHGNYFLASGL